MNKQLVVASLILWLGLGQAVSAAVPSKNQVQCLLGLQSAGHKLVGVAGNDALACVREVAKGKLAVDQIDACLTNPSPGLQKARAKSQELFAKQCSELPDFGPNSAQELNSGYGSIPGFNKLFGSNLAAKLKTMAIDPAAAVCQTAVAEEMLVLEKVEIAEYGRCSKKALSGKRASSAADLERCVDSDSPAMQKAKVKVAKRLAQKCANVSTAANLSGDCSGVAGEELASCLAAQAHCSVAQAVNAGERLKLAGHTFQNGVAQYFCGDKPKQTHSVARQWNEQILDAIRIDNPRPPVHARNLFHLSAAMYDAWAAYDVNAAQYLTAEYPAWSNPRRAREIAISFAAYRVLSERYSQKHSLGYAKSQPRFDQQMAALGLDKSFNQISGDSPAAVGNRIAAAILAFGESDGSNEGQDYADSSYEPVNKPLIVKQNGIELTNAEDAGYHLDPNRWQPLALEKIISQNGIPLPGKIQTIIGSHWGEVAPFALTKASPNDELYIDPGAPPQLGSSDSEEDERFKREVMDVIRLASRLDPDDGVTIDISPASQGHNSLGANDGSGYVTNPITGQPYTANLVKRADFGRVLAEWWADGPTSETPPGHWNAIANAVTDSPNFQRRIGGNGPLLGLLEWDVKMYFALNGATHDAAIVAWGVKRKYDGVRPITMVRYMAKMGQSSNSSLPSYHPNGLPLEDGLVELITAQSSATGQRHAHLVTEQAGGKVGDIAIFVWPGSPADVKTQRSGVQWVLGTSWVPYQRATFVTPAFQGYISGHSTFSRSAAEVLAAMTGSEYFPGGLFEYTAKKNAYLVHEMGPTEDITLQWASYFDAADQSGRSRIWGGIHVEADDFEGRRAGHQIGTAAFYKALSYFYGIAP